MEIKSTLTAAITTCLLVASAVGVAAQGEESQGRSVAYTTGTSGEIPEVVQGTQQRAPDGHRQMRGLRIIDIPVEFSDPRLSGKLTIWSNGAGEDFPDGFTNLEPRTYRIVNQGGAWAGSGERILAARVGEPRPLINHESMVLFGEGSYAGLIAYVFIELANQAPELEAVILDIEMAPLPEPVAVEKPREIPAPSRPTAGSISLKASELAGPVDVIWPEAGR
ncbi:MAG: hypothetical protein ACC726_09565 [Chloroflexota bacterium]